jgi:hypothetical protein
LLIGAVDRVEVRRARVGLLAAQLGGGGQELGVGDRDCAVDGDRVRRCVDAGIIAGDPTDIAHVLIGLALGLAAQETAGWLGASQASIDRRWYLGTEVLLHGLSHTAQADEPAPESPER